MNKSKWGKEEKETLAAIDGLSGTILDIAAGDGRFINKLLEVSDSVLAIDINSSELDRLRDNCPAKLDHKLKTQVVDITKKLPYPNDSFDGIFCTGTLHLFDVKTIELILDEIKRILKPEGKIVLDFATDIERIDKDENKVIFDGEGNYTSEEAIKLLKNGLSGISLEIEKSFFREEDLNSETGYNRIFGNFLIVTGTKRKKSNVL